MSIETLDITPTPRILRTLGEIPFQTWQCIAELVDNSIDAFYSNRLLEDHERKITVTWSSDSVGAFDRTLEVCDNASGMSIEQLQNAVRAGYTSNDPIGNLGLFGMGFNIATARLGEETTILSTRSGDTEWIGVKIDFQKLIDSKKFDAPIIRLAKTNAEESGTRITISKLKTGILGELSNKESEIRQRLELIYTPLLSERDIMITVKGKQLRAKNYCVWSESRYVRYNKQNVAARIIIDRSFGPALFDISRNCYLRPDEEEEYYSAIQAGAVLPWNIVEREKRLTGWLGIQRYADPNDFGIDFIRNGRKILISDKTFFQYENPLTLQKELQYPVELGTSIGGRIVGELHVDYLIPTYQKNDFDRADSSWEQTREAICGVGPFLPKARKAMGFTEDNVSPLCLLVNAYRRVDKGTKCLFAPNDIAKKYAAEFKKGTRDYIDDSKWWKAAQEEDQKNGISSETTDVNTGDTPSDDIGAYLGDSGINHSELGNSVATGTVVISSTVEKTSSSNATNSSSETSSMDDLLQRSTPVQQLSGRHYQFGKAGSLNIRAFELNKGEIKHGGERQPCYFSSVGIDCDFIYDPTHPLLAQYSITPKMLLLIYMAEKLKVRDGLHDIVAVYSTLVNVSMEDARIDRQALVDRSSSAFELMRGKLIKALRLRADDVVKCIHESTGEVEETVANIINVNSALLAPFQNCSADGFDAVEFVPPRTLYRLVERFPEDVFDGKVFSTPYMTINLSDEKATQRARDASKDRILSFIKDALRIVSGYGRLIPKDELTRTSLSVDFLARELEL